MRKNDVLLKEFAKQLSDDDLKYLAVRFTQNYQDDRADVLNKLASDKEMDRYLSSATDGDEFFDILEKIGEYVVRESKRRSSVVITDN